MCVSVCVSVCVYWLGQKACSGFLEILWKKQIERFA